MKATRDLRSLFERIDYLGRAQLTDIEIKRLLKVYPSPEQLYDEGSGSCSDKEIEDLIMRFNKNKQNGKITMQEFIAGLEPVL
jgi:Ca2+-binding EF-hand superfamily protein